MTSLQSNSLILDTETHTLYGIPIEIAYLPIQLQQGQLSYHSAQMFDQYYSLDDGVEIDLAAMAVHHILPHDLINQPHYTTFKLPQNIEYIIGHNIEYDLNALKLTGVDISRIKPICTLALARHAWAQLPTHSLGFLSYFISNDLAATRAQIRSAHRADTDVLLTAQLLEALIRHYNISDMAQLYQQSQAARLPAVMPFGKHRGTPLAEVPRDYIQWLLGQSNVDSNLREALENIILS